MVNLIFNSPLSMTWVVVYAVIIVGAAVAGDLFESSIKRGAGGKGLRFPDPRTRRGA